MDTFASIANAEPGQYVIVHRAEGETVAGTVLGKDAELGTLTLATNDGAVTVALAVEEDQP